MRPSSAGLFAGKTQTGHTLPEAAADNCWPHHRRNGCGAKADRTPFAGTHTETEGMPHRGVRLTAWRRRSAVQRPFRPALVPAHIIVKPGTKTDRVGRHLAVPERNTPSRSSPSPVPCFAPQFRPSSGLQLRPPAPSGLRPDPSWDPTREPTAAGESRFSPRCSRSGRCCPAVRGAAAWHARG